MDRLLTPTILALRNHVAGVPALLPAPRSVGQVVIEEGLRHCRDDVQTMPMIPDAVSVRAGRNDRLMFVCPELHALKAGAGQAGVGVEEQVVGGFGASPGG